MKTSKTFVFGLLVFLFVISVPIAFAGQISKHDRVFYIKNTIACTYKNKAGQTMPYRLFIPKNYDANKRYPLLLTLHGALTRGNDNMKHLYPWVAGWLDEEVQRKHPCIILMPQCPAGQQWVDTPWEKGSYSVSTIPISKPMKLVKEIVDKVLEEKSIDQRRIYVMGASLGGYGVWDLVMRYPDLIAAAVPICGAGDPSMAEAIRHVPIWIFHGSDDDIVPLAGSLDMIDAIKEVGGTKAQLTVYRGVRHGSYKKVWREQAVVDWMFKQQKMDNKPTVGDGKKPKG